MITVTQHACSGVRQMTGAEARAAAAAAYIPPAVSLPEQIAALRDGVAKQGLYPSQSRPRTAGRPIAYGPCGTPLRVLERAPVLLAALPPDSTPAADGLTARELMHHLGWPSSAVYEVLQYLSKLTPSPIQRANGRRAGHVAYATTYRLAAPTGGPAA